ncbi:hypothetical protein WJX73_003323 [Symbiochloris irregularis]|uniref:Uncharacterized protein n=1 Tax=Symbiochloris irregularis TaxID=706552 RepID=A0AAW1P7T8_9CHLO
MLQALALVLLLSSSLPMAKASLAEVATQAVKAVIGAQVTSDWGWNVLPMQLTEGSTLQSIFIEKDVVAYGHYVAGVFNGTLIINGTSLSSAAGGLFAARFDSNNNIQWVLGGIFGMPFGRAQGTQDQQSLLNITLNGIAVNPNTASLVLVGDFKGDGIQFSTTALPASGSANVFVAHVAGNGDLPWAKSYSGDYILEGHAVAWDASNNLWMVGRCQGDCDMGSTTTSPDSSTADATDDADTSSVVSTHNRGNSADFEAVVVAGIDYQGDISWTNHANLQPGISISRAVMAIDVVTDHITILVGLYANPYSAMGQRGLGGALGVLALWQNGTWLLDGIATTFASSSDLTSNPLLVPTGARSCNATVLATVNTNRYIQLGGASGTAYSLANSGNNLAQAGMMPDVSQSSKAQTVSITVAGEAQQAATAEPLDSPRGMLVAVDALTQKAQVLALVTANVTGASTQALDVSPGCDEVYVVGVFSGQIMFQSPSSVSKVDQGTPADVGYIAGFNSTSGDMLWSQQYTGQSTQVSLVVNAPTPRSKIHQHFYGIDPPPTNHFYVVGTQSFLSSGSANPGFYMHLSQSQPAAQVWGIPAWAAGLIVGILIGFFSILFIALILAPGVKLIRHAARRYRNRKAAQADAYSGGLQ